jgi:elongation factor Ts
MSTLITTELVKELRDSTGISVMQCKKALEEAEGNMEKALAILKKTSSDIALKKSERNTADGAVKIKSENGKAILISLHCETDFVSRNEDFVNLLEKLTNIAFDDGIEKMKEISKENIDAVIQKTGENIQLGEIYELSGNIIGSYVHNNKSGVLVSLEGGNIDLAKNIAMHITAMKPEYIFPEDIDAQNKKTMEEIFEKEIANVDKPAEIKQKMLEGKINTYFKEKTLLNQTFIKDPNETIETLLKKNNAILKEVKRYSIK